jgi:hypothetical protein
MCRSPPRPARIAALASRSGLTFREYGGAAVAIRLKQGHLPRGVAQAAFQVFGPCRAHQDGQTSGYHVRSCSPLRKRETATTGTVTSFPAARSFQPFVPLPARLAWHRCTGPT